MSRRRSDVFMNIEALERRDVPAVSIVPPASAPAAVEGMAASVGLGSFTESVSTVKGWTLTVDWGDGTPSSTTSPATPGPLGSLSHAYADNGVYTITEKLVSSAGSTDQKSFTISVANAAPIAALPTKQAAATVSDSVILSATVSDPSSVDASAGLVYTWDFGDGSAPMVVADMPKVQHVYRTVGSYTVRLTVADKDGGVSVATTQSVKAGMLPIPDLSLWQSHMTTYGATQAALIANLPATGLDGYLGDTFYDAERVYYQIADYTKNNAWLTAAQNAEKIYRDAYVYPNNGGVLGYWNFAKGLELDYLKTGDAKSLEAIRLLSQNGSYLPDSTPLSWTANQNRSREVAYAIMTLVSSETVGFTHRTKLDQFVTQALGHIDQWFVSKTAAYYLPFMVGLTTEALIAWYQKSADARVLPALKTALDGLWNQTWVASAKAFMYASANSSEGSTNPTADLNLMIAPAYAFMYRMTGDATYRDRGDQIFAGGVEGAWLDASKPFNQNYRWSFDYVNWRSQSPVASPNVPNALTLTAPADQTAGSGTAAGINLGSFADGLANDNPWSVSVDWGDGSPVSYFAQTNAGSIASRPHAYVDGGTYTVVERVISTSGQTDAKSFKVVVAQGRPTVSLTQTSYAATVSDSASFQAAGRLPSGADPSTLVYSWNFGDGSAPLTGIGLSKVTHVFRTTGDFVVSVTATDKTGAVSSPASAPVKSTVLPIPSLALWESQMKTYGPGYAARIANPYGATLDPLLGEMQHDAERIYHQIADYTKDASWLVSANNAEIIYRDRYLIAKAGGVAGYLNFSRGLELDYQKTQDPNSLKALNLLGQNGSYMTDATDLSYTVGVNRSVEVANAILSMISIENVGGPHRARLDQLGAQALGHLDQWFVKKTAGYSPSVVAQTAEALIGWYQKTGDARVIPALKSSLDAMWAATWVASSRAFMANNTPGMWTSPDLNLLIAPAYAFLYRTTGDVKYRDQADQIFSGGVNQYYTSIFRQFDQNYRWSFDYVTWRSQPPLASPTPSFALAAATIPSQTATEGTATPIRLGSVSDTLNDTPLSVSVDWGDGTPVSYYQLGQPGPIPAQTHVFANDGIYNVFEKIVSSSGESDSKSFQVVVTGVAPVASVTAASPTGTVSDPIAFSASAVDASSVDTAAGFTFVWDFGDGSPKVSGLKLDATTHAYRAAGAYVVSVVAVDAGGLAGTPATATVNVSVSPVPALAPWADWMTSYGQLHTPSLASNWTGALTPFDPAQVYFQIAQYTGSTSWLSVAQSTTQAVRDKFVLPNNGGVSGQYAFGRDLLADYRLTGNPLDKNAISLLVANASGGGLNSPISSTDSAWASRDAAGSILTLLAAAELGLGNSARLQTLAGQAIGHVNQWFVAKTVNKFSPDQIGMTLTALAKYADATGDARVLPAMKTALDWMWNNAWSAADQAFRSVDGTTTAVQPAQIDSNLAIAAAFAWYYRQTGDATYRDQGDAAFVSGVYGGNLSYSVTAFAQNYLWSFDYVNWRKQAPKV